MKIRLIVRESKRTRSSPCWTVPSVQFSMLCFSDCADCTSLILYILRQSRIMVRSQLAVLHCRSDLSGNKVAWAHTGRRWGAIAKSANWQKVAWGPGREPAPGFKSGREAPACPACLFLIFLLKPIYSALLVEDSFYAAHKVILLLCCSYFQAAAHPTTLLQLLLCKL